VGPSLRELEAEQYRINIFWSDDDASWIADVLDLRYCSGYGATPADALREVQTAMSAWLERARVHGDAIPTPGQLRAVAERITAMTPPERLQTDRTVMIRAMRDGSS
jgi:predicted RNase H-like HicB family nuclease